MKFHELLRRHLCVHIQIKKYQGQTMLWKRALIAWCCFLHTNKMTTQTVHLTCRTPQYGYTMVGGTCVPDKQYCKIILPVEKMAADTEILFRVVKLTKRRHDGRMQQDVVWGPHRMQGTSHAEIELLSMHLMECAGDHTCMYAQYAVNQGAFMEAHVQLYFY